ncbi:MAG TPA: ComF family protein [Verrucomicrobium sp.]|nr:ComF family protein [Verrucomicrobium sp.]
MAVLPLQLINRYWTAFLDLLYTRRCESCEKHLEAGREGAARWLCSPCLDKLPVLKAPFCSRCGEPYEGAITDVFQCGNCHDLRLHFEYAVAAYRADETVRELIHRFKYNQQLHLRGLLGCLLERVLQDPRLTNATDRSQWLLVPIPLHHARRREREYNQSWELCTRLAKLSGITALDALQRVRATTPQASLSRRQRLLNLKRAFRIKRPVARRSTLQGKTILLVDDVLTTGSTASECAKVLSREGRADKVIVITVARG